MSDIADAQLHEIAAAQLAVDRQIEQRELAPSIAQLKANPNCPNVLEFERCFLTDKLSLIPRIAAARFNGWCQHLELLQFERSSKREIPIFDRIPTGRQISMLRFDSAGLACDREWVKSTHSGPSWPSAFGQTSDSGQVWQRGDSGNPIFPDSFPTR
jgi:hypothetical protein